LARLLNTQDLDRHSRRSFARRWAFPNHHTSWQSTMQSCVAE
jgi:hypothetical protein